MKFIFSQMAFFMAHQSNRRNLRFVLRFAVFTLCLIGVYSVVFHYIMAAEGRDYTPITGLYWTLTVMSTLGFGDITFVSDLGKMFTVVVLLSGVLLFMLVLPFTFIRYVYSPWLEAKANALTPRELPPATSGHVIVVGTDDIAMSIVERFERYSIPYTMLVEDNQKAIELFDSQRKVVLGDLDTAQSYINTRAENAAMVLALQDDLRNTNIAATVRGVSKTVRLAAGIDHNESFDILTLAGCDHVIHFSHQLGEGLARRVFNPGMESNVIGRFESLCIAEAPAKNTPFVGKSLVETNFRERFGLNIAGILQDNQYKSVGPQTRIGENDVFLLAGTQEKLDRYDEDIAFEGDGEQQPVLILGGGRVGSAVADTLEQRYIPFRVVEQRAALIPDINDERYVLGNAAQIETLTRAGIEQTRTVVVTTHNDDLNIYLTIYCRKLRPEIQIISRATHDRNVDSLYHAGANLVMSQATLAANMVTNLLIPGRVFMLTEGFNIFRLTAPLSLVGLTLVQSGIRNDTDCNVIAIRNIDGLQAPPKADAVIKTGDELILIGTVEAEKAFMHKYH